MTIFKNLNEIQKFNMVKSIAFDSGVILLTMRQGKPDNLNVHNRHMSVPIYGAATEYNLQYGN